MMKIEFDEAAFIVERRVHGGGSGNSKTRIVTLPYGRGIQAGDRLEFFAVPGMPRDVMIVRKVQPSEVKDSR